MVVKKRHEWSRVRMNVKDTRPHKVTEWLNLNFGATWGVDNRNGVWQFLWDGESKIYSAHFANEEDATLFALKWL